MANQDAAFGLRPLKTLGQADDSTGMSSHKILPGDASVLYQGSMAIGANTDMSIYLLQLVLHVWERFGEHSILTQQH